MIEIDFVEDECPPRLIEAVQRVVDSFSPKESKVFEKYLDRFCVGCEDVQDAECDGCDGKVFFDYDPFQHFEYYKVNIWPHMLERPEGALLCTIAHEFGHLFAYLASDFETPTDEDYADDFARRHGFPDVDISS